MTAAVAAALRSRRRTVAATSVLGSAVSAGGTRVLLLPFTAATSVFTTRLQISHLGVEQFAFVSLILSLSVFLPFADLGVGAAVVNCAAQSKDVSADPALRQTLLTSLRVLTCTCIALLTTDVVLTATEAWPAVLGVHTSRDVNLACGLAIALLALGLPVSLGQRLLLGMSRNATLVLLQALVSPLTLVVTLAAVRASAGLVAFAVALPIAALLASSAQTTAASRRSGIALSGLAREALRPTAFPGRSVRATAGPMMVVLLGLPLALQTDRLILGHASTTSQVATYAVGFQLYSPAWSVAAAAGLSLWPLFARQRATGTASRAGIKALAAFGVVGVAGAVALAVAMPWVSGLVGAGRVGMPRGVALAFAALLLVQSLQLPVGMFLTSPSGLRLQAACIAAMVPVSCGLSYVLSGPLGAVGPLVGSVAGIAACQVVPGLWRSRFLSVEVGSSGPGRSATGSVSASTLSSTEAS